MKENRNLSLSIILLFAMLWLPVGDYSFLLDNWMKIGTFAVPFLLIGIFSFMREEDNSNLWSNFKFLAILMLIAYIIHQFEEHWIDVLGNHYAFYTFINNMILGAFDEPQSTKVPLTKASIFVINTALVWLIGLIAVLRSPKHLFPFFAMAGIIIVNAFVHIMSGVTSFQYNPGLLTSLLVFVPLYIWIVQKTKQGRIKLILAGIVWAFLGHVIMVGGLLAANWFEVIPEMIYFVLLVFWSILPLFLFRES